MRSVRASTFRDALCFDRFRRWSLNGLRASLLTSAVIFSSPAFPQTFVSQGPAPSTGPLGIIQSGDVGGVSGTVAGAIQSIVTDPTDPNIMYISGVNGGVWKTTNGGPNWTPLTDNQASLSIASLELDPTDPTRQNLIAGVGITSNGAVSLNNQPLNRGGARTGLLLSQNGGATWTALGQAQFSNLSVLGVAERGSTILAATYDPYASTSNDARYGLYRSTNNGTDFQQLGAGQGLNAGPVTSLAADPNTTTRFFASTTSAATQSTVVYVSNNTGASWQPIFDKNTIVTGDPTGNVINSINAQTVVKLATGPDGSIAVGVIAPTGKLAGLYLSRDAGQSWTALTIPSVDGGIHPGGQGLTNFAIAIDPKNSNIVYIAGDRQNGVGPLQSSFPNSTGAKTYTASVWKVQRNSDNSTTLQTLTDFGTADGSTIHADSRNIAFDANGRLILVGDGGIYARTNPQSTAGVWTGLNTSGLSLREIYGIGFDAVTKRLVVASQDTGASVQLNAGSNTYVAVQGGDGVIATVNDTSISGMSAFYTSSQGLDRLSRIIGDKSTLHDPVQVNLNGLIAGDRDATSGELPFSSQFVLNRINQSKIAIGTNYLYVTQDPLDVNASEVDLALTSISPIVGGNPAAVGGVSALVYGVADDPGAVLAGTTTGLYLKRGADATVTKLNFYVGATPSSVVFDARTIERFYVADTTNLYGTNNRGAAFSNLTPNLPANFSRPSAVEFISQNGVNALLIGGLASAANVSSTIAVADSDVAGVLSGWRLFGAGLPNAQVSNLVYNPAVDALAVGTFGRGAWLLYDVTSYFPQATVLRFGLADNDSAPDASFLTNGTAVSRVLDKVGTGTLVVSGAASYTGATTIDAGTMVVNGSIASSSGVTVNSGATLAGTGTVASTLLNGGANLSPGPGVGTLSVNGTLTFATGSNYFVDVLGRTADKTAVSGAASLSGGTAWANVAGTPLINRYTILTSAGLDGTKFASLRSSAPSAFIPSLSYSTTDAFLNFTASLGTGATPNQNGQAVADALNTYFNNGGTLLPGFATVFGLSGTALTNALAQLSGQPGASTSQTGFAAAAQFTNAIFDGAFDDNTGQGPASFAQVDDGAANAYVAKRPLSPNAKDAYAAVTPRDRFAPPSGTRWNVWASAYGGNSRVGGDAAMGTTTTTSRIFGTAVGASYRPTPNTQIGFALGGSGTNFSLDAGLGSGRADVFNAAVYAKQNFGAAYLAGLLGYSWQDTMTDRTVTIAGTDKLRASFQSQALAARLEGGWRYATPMMGVTPYAALQTTTFYLPSYGETATSGSNQFALNYASQAVTATRGELGARFDKAMLVRDGLFTLKAKTAWAHDWNTDRTAIATFQALPGATFVTGGARPSADAALLSVGADMKWHNGWSVAASFDGEFSRNTAGYAGKGSVRYAW